MRFSERIENFFWHISSFQYENASISIQEEPEEQENLFHQIKWWSELAFTFRLLASCESTYHLMTYLDEKWIAGDRIEKLYLKLVESLVHHADELGETVQSGAAYRIHSRTDWSSAVDPEESMFYANLFHESAKFFEVNVLSYSLHVLMLFSCVYE